MKKPEINEPTLQIIRYHATLGEAGEHKYRMAFSNPIQTRAQLYEVTVEKAVIAATEDSRIAALLSARLGAIGLQAELKSLEPIKVVKDLVGPEAQSTLVIVDAAHELMHRPHEGEIDEFKLCMMIGYPNHPLIATLEER